MGSGFLASLLAIERAGDDGFRARLHDYDGVSFGGDALARMALAASDTAAGRALHALHAVFLRPVPPAVPVAIRVEVLAEGRRLARRRVWIEHEGRTLCHAIASFTDHAADAPRWQEAQPPAVALPEALPPDLEVAAQEGWRWNLDEEEFAWRFVDRPWRAWERGEVASDSRWCVWLQPRDPLPDDDAVHAAALVFASDLVSHWSACRRVGRDPGPGFYVSLDHALHVHRARRWDDWWLLESRSGVAHDGRTHWERRFFARDGALLATVSQEALIRLPPAE